MRASKRRFCSSSPTSSQNLISWMPVSTTYFSISGQSSRKRRLSVGVQRPIHRLLRAIGKRHLDTEAILDETGTRGVAFHTPDWEDYVTLAMSEIRAYGCTSLQVVRRLRAMLDNLVGSLPSSRRPPLEMELRILERAVERSFPDAEDRLRAGVADTQGLGHVD
jgi:uncharacterized membrane protein